MGEARGGRGEDVRGFQGDEGGGGGGGEGKRRGRGGGCLAHSVARLSGVFPHQSTLWRWVILGSLVREVRLCPGCLMAVVILEVVMYGHMLIRERV